MAQTEKKELMTNELVKGVTRAYEGLKKGPSRGTIITLAVVVAIVLIIVLFVYFIKSSSTEDSARWLIYDGAVFSDQVTAPIEAQKLENTNQQRLLRCKAARMTMARGVRGLGSGGPAKRKQARESVKQAREIYEDLIKNASSISPVLHQEARYDAAKAAEALGGTEGLAAARG